MKKKLITLLSLSSLLLVACGQDEPTATQDQEPAQEEQDQQEEQEEQAQEDQQEEQEEQTQEEEQAEEASEVDDSEGDELEEGEEEVAEVEAQSGQWPDGAYWSQDDLPKELEFDSAKYTIHSIDISEGSMTGSTIITLTMDYENLGDQTNSPYLSFITDMNAVQTDGNTTVTLNGANAEMDNLEDQEAVSMGDTQVNPGGEVHATIGYTLSDPSLDVGFIIRSTEIMGNPQGFAWSVN